MSKYPFKIALSTGLFYFVQFFMSGAGFLFGIQCIRGSSACPISVTGSHYTLGETHVVFFETFLCSFYILQLAANYDDIRNAILASKDIFKFM